MQLREKRADPPARFCDEPAMPKAKKLSRWAHPEIQFNPHHPPAAFPSLKLWEFPGQRINEVDTTYATVVQKPFVFRSQIFQPQSKWSSPPASRRTRQWDALDIFEDGVDSEYQGTRTEDFGGRARFTAWEDLRDNVKLIIFELLVSLEDVEEAQRLLALDDEEMHHVVSLHLTEVARKNREKARLRTHQLRERELIHMRKNEPNFLREYDALQETFHEYHETGIAFDNNKADLDRGEAFLRDMGFNRLADEFWRYHGTDIGTELGFALEEEFEKDNSDEEDPDVTEMEPSELNDTPNNIREGGEIQVATYSPHESVKNHARWEAQQRLLRVRLIVKLPVGKKLAEAMSKMKPGFPPLVSAPDVSPDLGSPNQRIDFGGRSGRHSNSSEDSNDSIVVDTSSPPRRVSFRSSIGSNVSNKEILRVIGGNGNDRGKSAPRAPVRQKDGTYDEDPTYWKFGIGGVFPVPEPEPLRAVGSPRISALSDRCAGDAGGSCSHSGPDHLSERVTGEAHHQLVNGASEEPSTTSIALADVSDARRPEHQKTRVTKRPQPGNPKPALKPRRASLPNESDLADNDEISVLRRLLESAIPSATVTNDSRNTQYEIGKSGSTAIASDDDEVARILAQLQRLTSRTSIVIPPSTESTHSHYASLILDPPPFEKIEDFLKLKSSTPKVHTSISRGRGVSEERVPVQSAETGASDCSLSRQEPQNDPLPAAVNDAMHGEATFEVNTAVHSESIGGKLGKMIDSASTGDVRPVTMQPPRKSIGGPFAFLGKLFISRDSSPSRQDASQPTYRTQSSTADKPGVHQLGAPPEILAERTLAAAKQSQTDNSAMDRVPRLGTTLTRRHSFVLVKTETKIEDAPGEFNFGSGSFDTFMDNIEPARRSSFIAGASSIRTRAETSQPGEMISEHARTTKPNHAEPGLKRKYRSPADVEPPKRRRTSRTISKSENPRPLKRMRSPRSVKDKLQQTSSIPEAPKKVMGTLLQKTPSLDGSIKSHVDTEVASMPDLSDAPDSTAEDTSTANATTERRWNLGLSFFNLKSKWQMIAKLREMESDRTLRAQIPADMRRKVAKAIGYDEKWLYEDIEIDDDNDEDDSSVSPEETPVMGRDQPITPPPAVRKTSSASPIGKTLTATKTALNGRSRIAWNRNLRFKGLRTKLGIKVCLRQMETDGELRLSVSDADHARAIDRVQYDSNEVLDMTSVEEIRGNGSPK